MYFGSEKIREATARVLAKRFLPSLTIIGKLLFTWYQS